MDNNSNNMAPFWDHVAELRRVLLTLFAWILLGTLLSFAFYPYLIATLTKPLKSQNPPLERVEIKTERWINRHSHPYIHPHSDTIINRSQNVRKLEDGSFFIPPGEYIELKQITPANSLLVLGPLEGFSIVFKVCFWLGIILSSPAWGYTLLRFIYPALRQQEQSLLLPFILSSILFLLAGCLFAFYITIPTANHYFASFNNSIGSNFWTLSLYLDYTFFLMLSNALIFEIGLILLFLVHSGILTHTWMIQKRKYMIVLSFILGALLTPPEVLTQLLAAIPLIALYELAILYAKFREAKQRDGALPQTPTKGPAPL